MKNYLSKKKTLNCTKKSNINYINRLKLNIKEDKLELLMKNKINLKKCDKKKDLETQ